MDMTLEEEQIIEDRVSLVLDEEGNIFYLNKCGVSKISPKIIKSAVDQIRKFRFPSFPILLNDEISTKG